MSSTAHTLRSAAHLIAYRGLHTGEQFADASTGRLDICAAAYLATRPYDLPERLNIPTAFFTDEGRSRELIEASKPAMDAIHAISKAITNYKVPDSDGQPDVIEHVSQWTFTAPIGQPAPPSTSEVIACILRAAQDATGTRYGFTNAWGICTTCGGHGSVTGDEIPFDELLPRQKQGHAHGRRYHRSKPCPHCDGKDRVTDDAISAYEASL